MNTTLTSSLARPNLIIEEAYVQLVKKTSTGMLEMSVYQMTHNKATCTSSGINSPDCNYPNRECLIIERFLAEMCNEVKVISVPEMVKIVYLHHVDVFHSSSNYWMKPTNSIGKRNFLHYKCIHSLKQRSLVHINRDSGILIGANYITFGTK